MINNTQIHVKYMLNNAKTKKNAMIFEWVVSMRCSSSTVDVYASFKMDALSILKNPEGWDIINITKLDVAIRNNHFHFNEANIESL